MTKANTFLPTVLQLVSWGAVDMSHALTECAAQFPEMISDGSWAIKRSALMEHYALPKFLLGALAMPINDQIHSVENLCAAKDWELQRIEPAQNKIGVVPGMKRGAYIPTMEFKAHDAYGPNPVTVVVNAKILKFIWELFPCGDWYVSPAKTAIILMLEGKRLALIGAISIK